ncbi:NUDIX domain-containing protein [Paenibacillaceae bacterium WGS1546]|uniref:NUDIX hydrolase n=1 Tax=Cohnella sp. WGS1546 TaxID=3366810 RepID=UPI00372CF2C9
MPEIFDVYDDNDEWIGTAERGEAHAQGLWHRTVHCWLVRKTEQENGAATANVLFQQRAAGKDTNPGRFDITAAGHLAAGETPEAVVRELEEELGLRVEFERLAELGVVTECLSGTVGGKPFVDKERSRVFGLVVTRPLADFRLQEEEVAGLYEADADELIALMEGRREHVRARGVVIREGKLQAAEAVVACSSFVERDLGYYVAAFKFLRALALR